METISRGVASVRAFCARHKWKLGVSVGMISAGYAAKMFLERKLDELNRQAASEQAEMARRQVHFERNQRSGNITVEAVLPEMQAALQNELGSIRQIARLKELRQAVQKDPDQARVTEYHTMWDEIKVVVFTELLVSVYTLSLLVTFLRVQLNILGGYLYARAREFEDEGECTSTETEAEYLRQAHRLKTHGVPLLVTRLRPRLEDVLAAYPIESKPVLSQPMLVKSLVAATAGLAGGPNESANIFSEIACPPHSTVPSDGGGANSFACAGAAPSLEHLLDETRDVVDSDVFRSALDACVTACLKHVENNLAIRMFSMGAVSEDDRQVPLAKLVPAIHKEARALFQTSGPVNELLELDQVQDLSSRVYESFCESAA